MKRLIYVFLTVAFVLFLSSCDIDISDLVGEGRRKLSKEETMFTLGRYPQTLVTDSNIYVDVLNTIDESKWELIPTFAVTTDDGEAQYIDIDKDNDGLKDYRLVKIIKDNGSSGKVESPYEGYYLFNWEPVKWNIIRREGEIDNKKEAYAFSDIVLDATIFDANGNFEYAKSDLRKMVVVNFASQIFNEDEINSLKGDSYEDTFKKAFQNNSSYENDCIQIVNTDMITGTTSSDDGSLYYNARFSDTRYTDYSKLMGAWRNTYWTSKLNTSDNIMIGKERHYYGSTPDKYHGVMLVIIVDYDKYRPEGY